MIETPKNPLLYEVMRRYKTPGTELYNKYNWDARKRDKQTLPEGDWKFWALMCGRGWGKTATGSNTTNLIANSASVQIGLIGATAGDVRDTMIEGPTGILAVSPPWNRPKYIPSKRLVVWPNGSRALLYTGEEPDQIRGPNLHWAWLDEPTKFRYIEDVWNNLEFSLRAGDNPRAMLTFTPKYSKWLKDFLQDPDVHLTPGSTFENEANLPESFLKRQIRKYEGTRIGRQELYAELLGDVEGALWKQDWFDNNRFNFNKDLPDFAYIVVAVDPPGSEKTECGIVVVAIDIISYDVNRPPKYYVLADYSLKAGPNEWANEALSAYAKHQANIIAAESNFGGNMVENTIHTINSRIPVKMVRATRGKALRAEPIIAIYEQGNVHHVGHFAQLEEECTTWVQNSGQPSPNRLDALVWGCQYLLDMTQSPASGTTIA